VELVQRGNENVKEERERENDGERRRW